ncbi:MAG: PilW family protein, partial [Thermodesulfobacteriota bacterium]
MNSRGYTIIEMLVTVAIFSLIITGMTIALMQQQRQFNLTQDAIDVDQTGRAALDYIATDIRNAGARQGKSYSIKFLNGGSGESPPCSDNTTATGADSPPDCFTVYTWDIAEGQYVDTDPGPDETVFPSITTNVQFWSLGPPLVLNLPEGWFKDKDGNDFVPPLIETGDFIGVRSRLSLCNPKEQDPVTNPTFCITNPKLCTECSAILRVDINDQNQAVVDLPSDIIEQNFKEDDFTDLGDFVNNFFLPSIASLASEMSIVEGKTFRVNGRELEVSQAFDANGNPILFQPIAGGVDAPGVVDVQLVFNLQNPDGGITKVGVPLDATKRMFPDFESLKTNVDDPTDPAFAREHDVRSVFIYVVVRSKSRPLIIYGGFFYQLM